MQPAMFQCLLGLECEDFTMVAADQTATKGVYILKNDIDKLLPISDGLIMGVNGDSGDILQFSNFINNNFELYRTRNGYGLGIEAAVHFTRKNLDDSFRSGTPYALNLLMAGWDKQKGGQLYLLDNLGTCIRTPFAAHGFAGLLGISILDYCHRRDMSEAQAYGVLQLCVREIHQRLFINLPNFIVKVVSEEGISTLPIITPPLLDH